MPFFFVSAADGTNVVQMFEHAIKVAWAHKKDPVRVQWLLVQTASEIGRVSSSAPPARLTPWLYNMSCSFFFSFCGVFGVSCGRLCRLPLHGSSLFAAVEPFFRFVCLRVYRAGACAPAMRQSAQAVEVNVLRVTIARCCVCVRFRCVGCCRLGTS
jgi:hypothetical protein